MWLNNMWYIKPHELDIPSRPFRLMWHNKMLRSFETEDELEYSYMFFNRFLVSLDKVKVDKMVLVKSTINLDDDVVWSEVINSLEQVGIVDIDTPVYDIGDGKYMAYFEKLHDGLVKDINHGWVVIDIKSNVDSVFYIEYIYCTKDEVEAIKSISIKYTFSSIRMFVNTLKKYMSDYEVIADAS